MFVKIGMFRNHIGTFPLSRHAGNRSNTENNTKCDKRDESTTKKLSEGGIWQFVAPDWIYDIELPLPSESNGVTSSSDNFKYIDISFDILDNKCTIFTSGIKMILKQFLEPIYIKPEFDHWDNYDGRRAFTTFCIYQHK